MFDSFTDPALFTPAALAALISLTVIEIVLGIDNVIFIAILAGKLPPEQQKKARTIGLLLAMVQRILFLMVIGWIIHLDKTVLFHLPEWWPVGKVHGVHGEGAAEAMAASAEKARAISFKDLIIFAGGVFLIFKATHEIHAKLEGPEQKEQTAKRAAATFGSVMVQIMLLDAVFSVDSVLTAVGLTDLVPIMVIAVVVSVIIMIVFAEGIAKFVEQHPSMKMLALAILVTIGVLLVAEAFEWHIPRGYLYFAMAFAFGVEMLNIKVRGRKKTHRRSAEDAEKK